MKQVHSFGVAFLLIIFQLITSCSPGFEEINHTVVAIQDGCTLELNNGVLVNLVGVTGTPRSQFYLEEKVLQQKVNITFDTRNYPTDLSAGKLIQGYAKLLTGESLNGILIKKHVAALNLSNLSYDSASTFKAYSEGQLTNSLVGNTQNNTGEEGLNKNSGFAASSDLGNLVEDVEKSVFLVSTFDEGENQIGQGTGFFVGLDGYAVSNYHVFENGKQWQITTADQKQYWVGDVIKASKEFDYVVFKIQGELTNYPSLKIASKFNPRKADDIFVVGNPRGLERTFTKGVVSALREINQPGDIIQFDAAISPGSSGSPIMNMKGEVLGIATMKYRGCENCNFAMNIHLLELD